MSLQTLQIAVRANDLEAVQALLAQDLPPTGGAPGFTVADLGALLDEEGLYPVFFASLPMFQAVIRHPVQLPPLPAPPADAAIAAIRKSNMKVILAPWVRMIGTLAQMGQTAHLVAFLTDRPELATPEHLSLALWKTTHVPGSSLPEVNDLARRRLTLTALKGMGARSPMGDTALEYALTGEPDQSALMPHLLALADPLAVAQRMAADYRKYMDRGSRGALPADVWASTDGISAQKRLRGLERLALVVPDTYLESLREACDACPLPGLDARLKAHRRATHLIDQPASESRKRLRHRS